MFIQAKKIKNFETLISIYNLGKINSNACNEKKNYSTKASKETKKNYSEYYKILNVPEDCDQITARQAFIKLAKIYHPDSRNDKANEQKFKKVEDAYRQLLNKFSQEKQREKEMEGEFGLYYNEKKGSDQKIEVDIQHTAPQHRQYLSYEGVGMGTPSQREKQFTKHRALRAAHNVIDFKVGRLSYTDEINQSDSSAVASVEERNWKKSKKSAMDIQTRYGIDRLVEDKIQESMARGEFDNLRLAGKPLQYQTHNPFVDAVTHKLNQVLIENGYAPEWVTLEKEIRSEKSKIRIKLEKYRMLLGPHPLSQVEEVKWSKHLSGLSVELENLNKTIDKYNLVVPIMSKQMVHFPIERISERILREGSCKEAPPSKHPTESGEQISQPKEKQISDSSSTTRSEYVGIRDVIRILKHS